MPFPARNPRLAETNMSKSFNEGLAEDAAIRGTLGNRDIRAMIATGEQDSAIVARITTELRRNGVSRRKAINLAPRLLLEMRSGEPEINKYLTTTGGSTTQTAQSRVSTTMSDTQPSTQTQQHFSLRRWLVQFLCRRKHGEQQK